MAEPVIRRLSAGDATSSFRCGDPDFDLFLQRYAARNQDRLFVGTTYAALDAQRVVGYVTVAVGQLDREEIPPQTRTGVPRYPLPVLRLARLAVDEAFQGHGLGKRLAAHAFAIALEVRAAAGCVGVVVDALPGRVSFYAELGFIEVELRSGHSAIRPRPVTMFLPIAAVEAALRG